MWETGDPTAFREREKKTQTCVKQDSFRYLTARDWKLEDMRQEKLAATQSTDLSQTTNLTGKWKKTLCLEMPRDGVGVAQSQNKGTNQETGDLDSRSRCCFAGIPEN